MASVLRKRFFRQLDTREWPGKGLSPLNRIIVGFIIVSVGLAILATEETIYISRSRWFFATDLVLGVVFATEYILRIWAVGERNEYVGVRGRLRYALTPAAICDLLAIVPLLLTFLGNETVLLRLVRLLRILALARLGRFSSAFRLVGTALRRRRYELLISVVFAGFVLLISAAGLYMAERTAQPELFGSIPRALWVSIVTLTTVGYGDAYPVTVPGQIFGALTAFAGIALVAMPAGILAASFSDTFQNERNLVDDALSPGRES